MKTKLLRRLRKRFIIYERNNKFLVYDRNIDWEYGDYTSYNEMRKIRRKEILREARKYSEPKNIIK